MENVCRTCLATNNLFSLKNDQSLIYKIETISSIQISLDVPNYPTTICGDCIEKVNQFYCFRKIVINSDNELKEKIEFYLSNKSSVNKLQNAKRTKIVDKTNKIKSPRKRKKIQSKVVSTSTPYNVKIEPAEDDSYLNRLVICDTEHSVEDDIKVEIDESSLNNTKLQCEKCSLTFYSKSEFTNHRKIHHKHKYVKKARSLHCEECNLTCATLSDFAIHKRKVHTAPGICNICGVVVRADNLKKHVQRHSEGPVKCKICSKVLKNSESLRGHLLIHKGTSYDCEQCDKTFRLKSEFNRHLKTHEDPNIRKKMCTVCGKHVRDLHRHLLTHTGERPYICPHCNKGLTSTYALKLHIRQHTNEKPFICEKCSKGFAQKVSLLAHLKSKAHGESFVYSISSDKNE